ncbi:hypothetical protein J2T60_001920 [Natronospira proteinivora]|uniref:O-antigen ligase-related domain-containing protein n=1 Tax=Natronospira proteinivora TaxID=1807133 RepID=A0ABT1G9D9_9GAMM|nr:O-antigen ligase family protein [Natronospira proteinivora]MCP1727920.1 hypothetical protein [Natronospira proteinivora]
MIQETREWWSALSNAQRFFIVCLLVSPLLLLLWRDGRNLSLLLAGLPGLWFGFRVGFRQFIGRDGHRWLWLVWAFLAAGVLSWGISGFPEVGSDRLDRHFRVLFFLPWLITLIWARPPARLIWLSLAVAGMGIGLGGLIEVWLSGEGLSHRVEGDAHVMSYGLISALIFTALVGAAWQHRGQRLFALLLAVGAMLALVGVVTTGVRAAILGLAGGIAMLAVLFAWFGDRRGAVLFLGSPALLVVVALVLAHEGVTARFSAGVEEVKRYYETEAAMPPRSEVRMGCQDDDRLLRAWLGSYGVSLSGPVSVVVVDGPATEHCEYGHRFRMSAETANARAAFDRSVQVELAPRPLRLEARGEGARVRLGDGEWQRVDGEFRLYELETALRPGTRIDWWVRDGGWVEWVPLASRMGDYRYPHVVGSMPQRLEMWSVAWQGFRENPLVGHGTGRFHHLTEPLIEQGLSAEAIRTYSHAHSEYLDTLATRGLLGLATLVLWLLGLIYIAMRPGPGQTKNAFHPGIPFAAVWVAFSLALVTEASLSMNLVTVTVGLLMSLTLYLTRRGKQPPDWTRNRLKFW